ncbi:hypothetical protein ACKVMT_14530 [Halobacteriales archaeon Cl-PHB]
MVDFDQTTTIVAFVVLFAALAGGTMMSPMQTSTVMMVLGGLFVFGVVTLLLGVKHGEYRAGH